MFSLDLDCTQDNKDLLVADLWEQGVGCIVELDPEHMRAYFEDDSKAAGIAELFGAGVNPVEEFDWLSLSHQSLEPMNVGDKFFLAPQWRDDPTPPGRFRIEVNNGLAFGTGRHETTRLCLQLLEKYVHPGDTVIDVGTGSGILAIAATFLGAARVIACDIDPLAVDVARAAGLTVFTGSAPAIASGVADLVVANISPECLREMAGEWNRLLKPGGHAILSGVEAQDQLPITPVELCAEAEWRAYVIQKSSQT